MALQLAHKIFIRGQLVVLTGLHIGGSKSTLDIGGIDHNVVKTAHRYPFIPGSSLKGKLRSLLARLEGSEDVKQDSQLIQALFGKAGDDKQDTSPRMTRLIIGDATFNLRAFERLRESSLDQIEEGQYTEGKMENKIDRKKGSAVNPREIERVLPGSIFDFEIIYNCCQGDEEATHLGTLVKGMELLSDDYLGGSGTRGYGKVGFQQCTLQKRTADDYQAGRPRQDVSRKEDYYASIWQRLQQLEQHAQEFLAKMPYGETVVDS